MTVIRRLLFVEFAKCGRMSRKFGLADALLCHVLVELKIPHIFSGRNDRSQ